MPTFVPTQSRAATPASPILAPPEIASPSRARIPKPASPLHALTPRPAPKTASPEDPNLKHLPIPTPRPSLDLSLIPVHTLATPKLQTKLTINQPGDEFEQEADRIADQVMRTSTLPSPANPKPTTPSLHRKCACGGTCANCQKQSSYHTHNPDQDESHDQKDHHLQRKPSHTVQALDHNTAPPMVHEVLRSPGHPLDPATRAFMEPRFGHDFGHVRVHSDSPAHRAASSIQARAFTLENHVAFDRGEYAPASVTGLSLLAHELAHVAQQGYAPQRAAHVAPSAPPSVPVSQATSQHPIQRKPNKKTPLEEYKSSKEHRAYLQSLRDLQAINAKIAEAEAVLRASDQRIADAKARLAALQAQGPILRAQLDAARVVSARADERKRQAIKKAEQAAAIAEESRRTAHRWGRILGVAELALHTLEAAVACPLSETGIGAVGCIHAVTSMYADSQQTFSGELTPNAFHQAGAGIAKTFGAGPQTANVFGGFVDMAGGFASASAAISAQPSPFTTRFVPQESSVPEPDVIPEAGNGSQPPIAPLRAAAPPAKPVITAHADESGVALNEVKYPRAIETVRPASAAQVIDQPTLEASDITSAQAGAVAVTVDTNATASTTASSGPPAGALELSDARTAFLRQLRTRTKQVELGVDPKKGFIEREGAGGVHIEQAGRTIVRSADAAADFVDSELGPVSLKGPIPKTGSIRGLAESAIKDVKNNTATAALFVDLSGLSDSQAALVTKLVTDATRGLPKRIFFIR